ncbi:M23 family metallopeptidase [Streptomyces sp. CBMA29]|uniref:M23 family metallopeptidase n=1 Tax=Streptomyces sp. CBMA29 TaxID=1896314 RepID=UPI001661BA0D|nr:M23 family metallopeptidase [Streptomyces sp. CBMA29]
MAVTRLLTGGPDGRAAVDPGFVVETGEDDLDELLMDTAKLIGPVLRVVDSAEHGLVAIGERGRVPVWGTVGSDGRLTRLMIREHRLPSRRPARRGLRLAGTGVRWLVRFGFPVAIAVWCWGMPTILRWASGPVFGLFVVGTSGIGYALMSLVEIWLWRAATLAALASVWRLTYLPWGHPGIVDTVFLVGLLLIVSSILLRLRGERQLRLSQPLRLPLTGTWYPATGGEIGAVDLFKPGRIGRRGRSLTDFAAYGAPVNAPCDGAVVQLDDGHPDSPPGHPRYGPSDGNHLAIDTGYETVLLAHLASGSLRVALGDTVRTGQLLAAVGNSGDSGVPHLRIEVARDDRPLPLRFAGRRGGGRLWPGLPVTVPPHQEDAE